MRKYFGSVAFAALFMLSAQQAWAEDPTSAGEQAAKNLVERLELERKLDSMFGDVKQLFATSVIGEILRDDKSGNMAQMFERLPGGRDRFAEILGDEFVNAMRTRYPDFRAEAARHYAAIFTIAELNELNVFFSSGVGAKWQASSPAIEKAMNEWGQKAGMKAGAEAFAAAMERVEGEQKGKGK